MSTYPRGCGTFDSRYCDCAACRAYRRGVEDGESRGGKKERAAIVADLRARAAGLAILRSMSATASAKALREAADRYERGEHEAKTTAVDDDPWGLNERKKAT